jgi:hypothetical protein
MNKRLERKDLVPLRSQETHHHDEQQPKRQLTFASKAHNAQDLMKFFWSNRGKTANSSEIEMDNVRDGSARRNSAAPSASFGSRCWRNRPGRKLPTWLVNNVLLISFIWQCLGVVLYRVAFNQAFTSSGAKFDLGVAVMLSFQLLQLLFLAVLFVKVCKAWLAIVSGFKNNFRQLTKQVLHRTVSSFFLLQVRFV